ncbi:hypothetical protein D6C78_10274, partial [Aureobasidium pullulans]
MIQQGSDGTPISAIPAALATRTTLLLGLWASKDQNEFAKELGALKSAIDQYGSQGLSDIVVGISVGSEDLYRNSVLGVEAGSDPGQDVSVLLDYIQQARAVVKGSVLETVPIG